MKGGNPRTKLLHAEAQCAYCDQPATTKDHVVPRSLFVPPLPLDMITVPCCGPCNAEKKQVDDFLRDYLVAIIDGHPNEIAEAIKTGTLQRAVDRGQSKLHKELGTAAQIMALTGAVIDLEPILVAPLGRYMRFAVKGIFGAKANMRIPEDHKLMVGKIDGLPGLDSYYEKLDNRGRVNTTAPS
jgi:hypothetical protein